MIPLVAPALDRRQPWLGLTSYREADSELFFGREQESLELLRLVRRAVLTVLFGPSGTGKTSLLNAGLFPRLREAGFLPISIRLDHSGDRPDYIGQIQALIAAALHMDAARPIEEEALAPRQAPADQETLWEYLHRVVFWDWRNNPLTPVLVFDQFEEIFTLSRNRPAKEEFLAALADLVENYIPAVVRARMEASGRALPFAHDQARSKVILSLREDFVWRLDGLRQAMPSVMHNRFAIARMNGEQALLAVREPGKGIVDGPVAEQIVGFVAAANQSRAAADGEDVHLASLQVDPALLSVVCRELNARRIEQENDWITEDLLEQAGSNILNDFYERGFAGLNPAVRIFVEDRLLTASGFRSTVPLEEAIGAGIAADDIRTLVDRRLIRAEERLGIPHLELTHDLLTKVVQKSRGERQEREQRERERCKREIEERERLEREAHQQAELWRTRRWLAVVGGFAAICLLLGVLTFTLYNKAVASAKKARVETTNRRISQAKTEFQISPTRGLLLAVETLNASRRDPSMCAPKVTCTESAANLLADLLSQTGGTPLIAHEKAITSLSFSADGKLLATADMESVKLWRVGEPGTPFQALSISGGVKARYISLSPDGKLLAYASFGAVKLFQTETQLLSTELRAGSGDLDNMGITLASFSGDSKMLLTTNGMGDANLWHVDHLEKRLAEWRAEAMFASFSSDARSIVTVDRAGRVFQRWLGQPPQHNPVLLGDAKATVEAAFFSKDGTHLLIPTRRLSMEGNRLINIFAPDTYVDRPLNPMNPLSGEIPAAVLSPDGGLIATADNAGTVKVWREGSPEDPFKELRGHEGPVHALAFSPDGKFIATGGLDGTVRLWQVNQPTAIAHVDRLGGSWSTRLDELTERAGKTAGRNFSRKESSDFFPDEPYHRTFPGLAEPKVWK